MRGRHASSARRPARRLAPSDRAAEDATLSPSPSREGREMALRDVSCKAFGPRSQVATGPRAGSAKTGRRSVPSAGPSPAAPSGQPRALCHQRPRQVRVEGPRRVWVRGPRGPSPGACSFPDAVAGRFSPKATSTEPTVNSPTSRPHTKPEAASLRTSDRRSLAPSRLLPLSGWLCSPGESLTWHFTSLPAGPGESSPRVSDGPAPHRTLTTPPPALFCICSFIPQFFTRKANAGARPGLPAGRKRLALVAVCSGLLGLLLHTPHGSRPALLHRGDSVPLPRGQQAAVLVVTTGGGGVSSLRR